MLGRGIDRMTARRNVADMIEEILAAWRRSHRLRLLRCWTATHILYQERSPAKGTDFDQVFQRIRAAGML